METLITTRQGEIATVRLSRGKVNAINRDVVNELRQAFEELSSDSGVRGVVLTGSGSFFSFGFDIPEFLSVSRKQFADYVGAFTSLYTYLFQFRKPVVAALNGHAIAGGCMLALACDHRVMVRNKAKISLNEIAFGSSVFTGSVEMLRFWVGGAHATRILYSGAMLSAEEALAVGLIHEVGDEDDLMSLAMTAASDLAAKPAAAFASIKSLLRGPVAQQMLRNEAESIREFVEIWYSEETRKNLHEITIR